MPVVPGGAVRFAQLPGRRAADPLPAPLGAGYSVRVVRIPSGPRTPHRHPYSEEVAYVAQGRGVAWEGDVATPVSPGDLLVVPTGVPHATVCHGDTELVLVCFFPRGDLAGNLEELAGPLRD